MDYTKRKTVEIFKPLIDTELIKMANWAKADLEKVKALIAEVKIEKTSQWRYFREALRKLKPLIYTAAMQKQLEQKWSNQLFRGTDQYAFYAADKEEEYEHDEFAEPEDKPIILEYYPEESHEALRQDYYWGGADADVLGLWTTKEGVEKIYHAHMEGFWIMGEDTVDLLQRITEKELGIS